MKRFRLLAVAIAVFAIVTPAAIASNCSVSPSPAVSNSTVLFHADSINGDNYLHVCGPFLNGFGSGCPGLFDLGFADPVEIPYTVAGPGTYTFTVAHEKGASYGNNIGHGYLQCQVELEVIDSVVASSAAVGPEAYWGSRVRPLAYWGSKPEAYWGS